MRTTRLAGIVASAALAIGGLTVASAPAASAATFDVEGCSADVHNFIAPVGSTIRITLPVGCTINLSALDYFGANPGAAIDDSGNPVLVTVGEGPGSVGVRFSTGWFPVFGNCDVDTSFWGYPLMSFCGGTASAPTPDWHQAVGRAGSDVACEDGWTASWEEWPNEGTGGWVCTRSVPMFGQE